MFCCCFQRGDKQTNGAALKKAIHRQRWKKTSRILKDHPELAKEVLSEYEFGILWKNAPLQTIQVLLEAWPEAYKEEIYGRNLVGVKIYAEQWDFLKSILPSCPNSMTAYDVYLACCYVPIDVFELMLDQQPNKPVEDSAITFKLIEKNKLEHFCAMLDRCPAATEAKDGAFHLTPLLLMFQEKEKINADWIGPILKANPDSAREKDFDGKTPLSLAYQHRASAEIINMIRKAYPEAENIGDNLGRLPKDLANLSSKAAFTAANKTMILRGNLSIETSYADDAVVVCRGDMLIRDPQLPGNEQDKYTYKKYSEQVHAREQIFGTLLDEFSKMVGVEDKDVIQKAAAIQAILAHYLSNKNDAIIDFELFDNPGYWFQQEILKLVMRVFCETKSEWEDKDLSVLFPSTTNDAFICMNYLNDSKNDKPSPKPNDEHVKAYNRLTRWLTEGLDMNSYSSQGPVLKPLQSLFNKLFIRRGQTSVHVIGDMVRGTLLLGNVAMLDEVVSRIKNTFPNITENQFRHPDSCNGLADFLTYVHDNLNLLPDNCNDINPYRFKANSSQEEKDKPYLHDNLNLLPDSGNDIIPYRFKANSSQKEKEKPLWFNLNFFLQVPEYHRVGFSGMFVACELQIGVEEEINKHRRTHVAYERNRILSNQPLLKNYDAMIKEEEGEVKFLRMSNCTEDDNKLIEKVLFGKIATEVLVPCTAAGNDDKKNILLFENGPFHLSRDDFEAGSFVKPERLCLNNRSLNWYALDCPKEGSRDRILGAFRAAGPFKLDQTKRYFVDSFVLKNIHSDSFVGTVGLHAHVGPYLIEIACGYVGYKDEEDVNVVKSGQNLSYLEQMCPVPVGTTALEVIVCGKFYIYRYETTEFKYDEMNMSLKVFDTE